MLFTLYALISAASFTSAFPFVARVPGVESSILSKGAPNEKRQSSCPFNPDHLGAAPYNSDYPYTGAQNGLPGTGVGGILVPATGDTAHAFEAPGPNDIRGPCPGLNTAANHHVSAVRLRSRPQHSADTVEVSQSRWHHNIYRIS